MRVSRLLALVGLLQARGSMTANELAAELGVSQRTVYRDVEVLTTAGVQLDAVQGPAGGYRMRRGVSRSLLALNAEDVDVIIRALLSSELDPDAAGTAARLLAALGPAAGARAHALHTRFLVPDADPLVPVVARAVSEQRALLLTQADGTVSEVEPLGLIRRPDAWHLATADATHALDGETIVAATLLDRTFLRPAGFELAAEPARR